MSVFTGGEEVPDAHTETSQRRGKIAFFKYTKLIFKDKTSQRPETSSDYGLTSGAGIDVTADGIGDDLLAGDGAAAVGAGVGKRQGSLSSFPATTGSSSTSSAAVADASGTADPTPAEARATFSYSNDGKGTVAAGVKVHGGSARDLGAGDGAMQRPQSLGNRNRW